MLILYATVMRYIYIYIYGRGKDCISEADTEHVC